MSHNMHPVESRGASLQYCGLKRLDGTFEWTPDEPAHNGLDQEKFNEELRVAEAISRLEGAPVFWYHNGIKVTSDIATHSDPWAWLTEQNAAIAN